MSSRRRLAVALVLSSAVAGLEFWGGAIAHSLALTTDAVHVCIDVFAMALALFAAIGATRRANRRKTFGYGRIEVLGALVNSAILLAATGVIAYEAVVRLHTPGNPHGATMAIIAAIGLVVNVTIGLTLHEHRESHNVRAALMHVAGDALGAIAVLIGGAIISLTGAVWIDPVLSLFVAAIIVIGVVGIVRDASDVLLEASPPGVDTADVESQIRTIGGITGVHDLHVWTIGSGSHALSAHVLLAEGQLMEGGRILERLRAVVSERYGIGHVTVQLESEHCDPGGIIICRTDPP
jgi:cobalt-zinc-cadmium efflux system protein